MTKVARNCWFCHIYWRNPQWKKNFCAVENFRKLFKCAHLEKYRITRKNLERIKPSTFTETGALQKMCLRKVYGYKFQEVTFSELSVKLFFRVTLACCLFFKTLVIMIFVPVMVEYLLKMFRVKVCKKKQFAWINLRNRLSVSKRFVNHTHCSTQIVSYEMGFSALEFIHFAILIPKPWRKITIPKSTADHKTKLWGT